jgi:hypothetical protein
MRPCQHSALLLPLGLTGPILKLQPLGDSEPTITSTLTG